MCARRPTLSTIDIIKIPLQVFVLMIIVIITIVAIIITIMMTSQYCSATDIMYLIDFSLPLLVGLCARAPTHSAEQYGGENLIIIDLLGPHWRPIGGPLAPARPRQQPLVGACRRWLAGDDKPAAPPCALAAHRRAAGHKPPAALGPGSSVLSSPGQLARRLLSKAPAQGLGSRAPASDSSPGRARVNLSAKNGAPRVQFRLLDSNRNGNQFWNHHQICAPPAAIVRRPLAAASCWPTWIYLGYIRPPQARGPIRSRLSGARPQASIYTISNIRVLARAGAATTMTRQPASQQNGAPILRPKLLPFCSCWRRGTRQTLFPRAKGQFN